MGEELEFGGRKEHAERVAQRLRQIFNTPALTLAGKLHSQPSDRTDSAAHAEARQIVSDWKIVREFCRNHDIDSLAAQFGKLPVKPAAWALFLVERYDHFDSELALPGLIKRFRDHGMAPPPRSLLQLSAQAKAAAAREFPHPEKELERLAQYARIAECVGLNRYRSAFDLMHFLTMREPCQADWQARFESVNSPDARGLLQRFRAPVQQALGEVKLRWKWHPLHSVLTIPANHGRLPVWACGTLTVDYATDAACFEAMARLCKALPHFPRIESELVQAPRSKSRIAMTVLLDADKLGKRVPISVALRFRPRDNIRYAQRCLAYSLKDDRTSMIVYTRDGEERVLSQNARLIDFAFSIHIALVAHFDFALINDRRVTDLMAPLQPGDRIEIVKGPKFTWLQREWLARLTYGERNMLRAAYRPFMISQALELFAKRYLNLDGFDEYSARDRNELMNELDRAAELYRMQSEGFFNKRLAEKANDGRPVLANYCLIELAKAHNDELNVPWRVDSAHERYHFKYLASMIRENKMAPISGNAPRQELMFKPTYYIVVAIDRSGIVFDILQAFHRAEATIIEVAARTVHPARAHVRVATASMSKTGSNLVKGQLERLAIRFHEVSADSVPGQDESVLPARPSVMSTPFSQRLTTHSAIAGDHYFYGRNQELSEIRWEIQSALGFEVLDDRTQEGAAILVCGPLKTGKSSLAQQALHKVRTDGNWLPAGTSALLIDLEAGESDTFDSIEASIMDEVARQWPRFAPLANLPCEAPRSLIALRVLMRTAAASNERRHLFMVVVDEAMLLLKDRSTSSDDVYPGLSALRRVFVTMPGGVLMLVGPSAPIHTFPVRINNLVTKFRGIKVGGLNEDDVRAMILQERRGAWGPMVVPPSFIDEISGLTGGNPYWIALLINKTMEYLRQQGLRGRDDKFLDKRLVKPLAEELVFDNSSDFETCFMGFHSKAFSRSMAAFEKLCRERRRSVAKLNFSVAALAQASGESRDLSVKLLECLVDTGGLKRSGRSFLVAAPILQLWLDTVYFDCTGP